LLRSARTGCRGGLVALCSAATHLKALGTLHAAPLLSRHVLLLIMAAQGNLPFVGQGWKGSGIGAAF